jgi:hypothetical protein
MSDNKTTLFVHGFNQDQDELARIKIIQESFAPFCEVAEGDIKLVKNREYGGYKNFCFVDVDFGVSKKIVDELTGQTFDGVELSISIAKPREPRRDFGGSNAGGGRRGGDGHRGWDNN